MFGRRTPRKSIRRDRLMKRTHLFSPPFRTGGYDSASEWTVSPQLSAESSESLSSSTRSSPTIEGHTSSSSTSSTSSAIERASSGKKSVGFLGLPLAAQAYDMEKPPRPQDLIERIPMRARSQSWLVRTRHLIHTENGTLVAGLTISRPSPVIGNVLLGLSVLCMVLTFPWCLFFCFKVIREYERAVVFRLGRLLPCGTKGPGVFFVMPCIDTYKVVDLRMQTFDVAPQEILSKDSVTVSVDAVIYFRVSNPVVSVTNVNDAQFSTKLLAQTTLRNVLGTKTLSEMLSERDAIASITEKVLDEGTDPWGVKVERVEVKDIRLPAILMRSMATEAETARDARARVIAADGEKRASHPKSAPATVIHVASCTARDVHKPIMQRAMKDSQRSLDVADQSR